MNGVRQTVESKKAELKKKLMQIKKNKTKTVIEMKKKVNEKTNGHTEHKEKHEKRHMEDDEIDGEIQSEETDYNEMDIEEERAKAEKRPKHLLKHFKVNQSIDSFFTGGTLHFCKDKNLVYAQRDNTVVRFNLSSKEVEYEISHVKNSITLE